MQDGKMLAASISGAPAPKDADFAAEPEVQVAADEEQEEAEAPAAAPAEEAKGQTTGARASDRTVAELSEAAAEEGDNVEDTEETLVAEIPPRSQRPQR